MRGPFQQAQEAMHSIRDYLLSKRVELRMSRSCTPCGSREEACASDAFDSPEWHSWQVLDSSDLPSAVQAVERVMREGAQHLASTIKYFGFGGFGPDQANAERIVATLRPRFEVVMTAGDRRQAREGQLAQFVEEQYRTGLSRRQQRRLVYGPAGTGKTLPPSRLRGRSLRDERGGFVCSPTACLGTASARNSRISWGFAWAPCTRRCSDSQA